MDDDSQPGSGNATPASSTQGGGGPPRSRPLVRKKPHRRGPYACDECRLRKRACDAGNPCGSCRRSETECTYDFRRHTPRPTTRIRALQGRLRQAHGWLQHIQANLPQEVPGLDLSECIQALDFEGLGKDDVTSNTSPHENRLAPSSASTWHSPNTGAHEHTKGHGLFMPKGVRAGQSNFYYGPLSDMSFILRTVETLQIVPPQADSASTSDATLISNLIDRPLGYIPHSIRQSPHYLAHEVPGNAQELVSKVLERRDLMLSFLHEAEVAKIALGSHEGNVSSNSLSLLHSVLALAYLYDNEGHQKARCDAAMQNSLRHFEISATLNVASEVSDELSLASTLCGAIFLLAVARNSRAYSYICNASSLVLRLGLLADCGPRSEITPRTHRLRPRLLASTLCLDMMGSVILDLPPCFRADLVPPEKLTDLVRQAETADDVLTVALLRQASLLAIPLYIRTNPAMRGHYNEGDHQGHLFRNALHDFQKWMGDAAPFMAKLAESQQYQSVKKELEITYHLSHVILFRPHLYYIKDMYAGKRISLAESYYALSCIKAASSIIPLAESMTPLPESWLTLHAVFSAVMCLVFLVASHPSTTLPSVAWQRARRGTRIIAANKCMDNTPATSIEVLKVITHTLRQTVYIDFDRIESMTGNRCNSRRVAEGNVSDKHSSPSALDSHLVADYGNSSTGDTSVAEDSGVYNEADRMLEQAEALEVDMDFQNWLDFDLNEYSD